MNFSGGLTLILHTVIIIIKWIITKPIHFIIILIVFGFFFAGFIFISKTSLYDSNISYIKNYHTCGRSTEINPNKKYIILRLDDVQSSYLKGLTIKMLNEGLSRGMPFTLAVIPLNLDNDPQMLSYLKKNNCNIEIAQHGFNNRNDIAEFQDLPEFVASNKLEQGLKILNQITKQKIITFIPPENIYSTGTALSARKKQFKIISGEGNALFDYSATTYNFDTLKLNTISSIINKCNKDAENKGFAIIMLHPQDYIGDDGKEDPIKYEQYIKLLDTLEKHGFEFTTMYDYYNYLEKKGLAEKFYDSTIKKGNNKRKKVLSNSGTKVESKKEEKNKITKNNYITKSKLIYFPEWINNYNFITNDYIIFKGNIINNIDAVYINDYKLSLFKPGNKQFNYILNNARYSNLKEGENQYKIYFEKDGIKILKETITIFYNSDWRKLIEYEDNLLIELNKKE